MRRAIIVAVVALGLAGAASAQKAQTIVKKPNYDDIYCSGVITTSAVPYDTYLISGEESSPQATFSQGQYVFINRGSGGGMNVGDEFLVTRPVTDPVKTKWFDSQPYLMRAMGQRWQDVGRIKVVALTATVATAQITHSCDMVYRGDYVRPFAPRTSPTVVIPPFDRLAQSTGKGELAMVVTGKDYHSTQGTNDVIYINLGSGQGVHEGDYFRVFRYQGTRHETAFQIRGMQDRVWGFGATPMSARYTWKDLPREPLGEGIVLRTGENSSTVLLTYVLREIHLGDYVELEGPRTPPAPPAPPAPMAAPANRPPTLSCSAERGQVTAGERVRISGQANDPDGDALRFTWRSNGGQIAGAGASVVLDTSGLAAGNYSVTGRVDDSAGHAADCAIPIRVLAAAGPAQASKTHEGFFRTQSAVVDNVFKRILDDVALRMNSEPNGRVLLVGYADARETNADQLASQRAANAKAYLAGKGVSAARVETRVAAGQSGAGRQNQRVDVVWVPAGATY
jgi:outer membrane protein OmpA-like peptidoglycan-associated protein